MHSLIKKFILPRELETIVSNSPSVIIPESKEMLFELIFGNEHTDEIEVLYGVRSHGRPLPQWCRRQFYRRLYAPP